VEQESTACNASLTHGADIHLFDRRNTRLGYRVRDQFSAFALYLRELTALLCAATLPVHIRVHIDILEVSMDAISYTVARANLAKTMEKVCNDHDPVIITRKRESPVVMISLEDFQAMEETAYLLRSPANARHLLESIAELEAGDGTERELIE
jgi:antitoxin YefM